MWLDASDPLSIAYIDLNDMTALLNNGDTIPITNLMDADGDECSPIEAVVAVAGDEQRGWWTVELQFVAPGQVH